jgi:hypothetical protein
MFIGAMPDCIDRVRDYGWDFVEIAINSALSTRPKDSSRLYSGFFYI